MRELDMLPETYSQSGSWTDHVGFSRHDKEFGFHSECGGAMGGPLSRSKIIRPPRWMC